METIKKVDIDISDSDEDQPKQVVTKTKVSSQIKKSDQQLQQPVSQEQQPSSTSLQQKEKQAQLQQTQSKQQQQPQEQQPQQQQPQQQQFQLQQQQQQQKEPSTTSHQKETAKEKEFKSKQTSKDKESQKKHKASSSDESGNGEDAQQNQQSTKTVDKTEQIKEKYKKEFLQQDNDITKKQKDKTQNQEKEKDEEEEKAGENIIKQDIEKTEDTTKQMEVDVEAITDSKVLSELRKQSYENLKKYDENCQEYLNIHRTITDNLFNHIDKRVRISIESINLIIKFFRDKMGIEQQYFKFHQTKLPKIATVFKDLQDVSTIWYPTLSRSMQELDDMSEMNSKQISLFAVYIEKNILKDLLMYDATEYELKVKNFREQISRSKKKAVQLTKDSQDFQLTYNKIYHDLMLSEDKQRDKNKDLFYIELKYKKLIKERMTSEVEYGAEVINYWNEMQKLELHRLELIQQAFQLYLQKYEDTYGKLPAMDSAIHNLSQFNAKDEGAKNFELEVLFNNEDLQTIQKQLNQSEKVTLKEIIYYVSQYKLSGLSKSSILQFKSFKCQRDIGNMNKVFKPCELIVTSDDILLIFDDPNDDEIKRASKKLQMVYLEPKKRKDKKEQCYLVETTPGIIFNSESKVLLKFETEEQLNIFIAYINCYKKELAKDQ